MATMRVRLHVDEQGRVTGRVTGVMRAAGLAGAQASPKGPRHGSGAQAVTAGAPLNLVQRWLGHAQLTDPSPAAPPSSRATAPTSPGRSCPARP